MPQHAIPYRASPIVALLVSLLAGPPEAAAQTGPAPNYPDFAFGAPAGEALLMLGAVLSNTAGWIPQQRTGWGPDAPHPFDRTADLASDFTGAYAGSVLAIGAGYALEAGYFGASHVRNGGVYAVRGPLVDLESALLATGFVQGLKHLTGRCRPRYFDGTQCTNELRDAFPSGHTAPVAAAAGARLMLSAMSTQNAGFRWGSFAMAESMAVATAFLRVRAGMHSWSDVAGGFLLGHAVGILVALAHPMRPVDRHDFTASPEATDAGGFALAWSGSF